MNSWSKGPQGQSLSYGGTSFTLREIRMLDPQIWLYWRQESPPNHGGRVQWPLGSGYDNSLHFPTLRAAKAFVCTHLPELVAFYGRNGKN